MHATRLLVLSFGLMLYLNNGLPKVIRCCTRHTISGGNKWYHTAPILLYQYVLLYCSNVLPAPLYGDVFFQVCCIEADSTRGARLLIGTRHTAEEDPKRLHASCALSPSTV